MFKTLAGLMLGAVMLASMTAPGRAEELTVVQYPDSNYEPGPGWPEGWTPPPAPTAITPFTQKRAEDGMKLNPQYKRVEMRVLNPLPNWTQEYPYYWTEDVVGCGDTLYVYWYPIEDGNLVLKEYGRSFGGTKLSSGPCRFEPVQYITEAKQNPEVVEANQRFFRLSDELDAAHPGLEWGTGLRTEGTPDLIHLFLNGGAASPELDVPAYLDTRVSRVRVPVRFISEFMGAQVHYDDATQQVTIRFPTMSRTVLKGVPLPGQGYADMFKPEDYFPNSMNFLVEEQTITTPAKTIVLTIDQPEALIDGKPVHLDAPPVVKDGRTMVPIRFIAEQMGCKVYWVGDQPIFRDSDGSLSGTYQVHIYTPFYPLYEYPSWYLENRALKF